jgi:hypothetical protein
MVMGLQMCYSPLIKIKSLEASDHYLLNLTAMSVEIINAAMAVAVANR